ncbi:hypothetical protein JCM10207_006073 [Rhodosporidiobolus poonsookiae]
MAALVDSRLPTTALATIGDASDVPSRPTRFTRQRPRLHLPHRPQLSPRPCLSRIFYLATWGIIEEEYMKHRRLMGGLERWCEERCSMGFCEVELDNARGEIHEAREFLSRLFGSLYGFHYIRERYLDHYRPVAPEWSDAQIFEATLKYEQRKDRRFRKCRVAEHSGRGLRGSSLWGGKR